MSISSSSAEKRGASLFSNNAAGFTLVEVLVAFTILGIALAVLFQSFGGGLRGIESASVYVGAAAEARSVLQRVGVDIPIAPGVVSGQFADGGRWEVSIERHAGAELRGGETQAPLALFSVEITVAIDDRRTVTIETLRLGPPQ